MIAGFGRPDRGCYPHAPEVAAENTEVSNRLCPKSASYPEHSGETRADPALVPPEELRGRCEAIVDLGEKQTLCTNGWDEVKMAKQGAGGRRHGLPRGARAAAGPICAPRLQ